MEEKLRNAFNVNQTPSCFLFYKANIATEYRGNPSKEQIKDFVRAAQFFYQMTTEEQLITQLIDEGTKSLESGDFNDAAHMFNEADSLDKWRDLYGGKIYSSLGK